MPRPRFARLDPARRDAIFDAASLEFGEHGFVRASYNRIIERAGLSKGAMYYYFDDKRDLFVTVVGDAMARMFDGLEGIGAVADVEGFWQRLDTVISTAWTRVSAEPRVARLLTTLLDPRNAADVPEATAAIYDRATRWTQEILDQGREVGAVRDDLPNELLLAVTLSVGEAIDRWVAARFISPVAWAVADGQGPEGPPAELLHTLVDLLRRLLQPA